MSEQRLKPGKHNILNTLGLLLLHLTTLFLETLTDYRRYAVNAHRRKRKRHMVMITTNTHPRAMVPVQFVQGKTRYMLWASL